MGGIKGGKGDVQRKPLVDDAQVAANWNTVQTEPETKPCGCKKWSLTCTHDLPKKKCDCPNWTLGCCGSGVKVE